MLADLKKKVNKIRRARRDVKEWPAKVEFCEKEYEEARKNYKGPSNKKYFNSPSEIGVQVVEPGKEHDFIKLPENYMSIVKDLKAAVEEHLECPEEIDFDLVDPKLKSRLQEEIQTYKRTSDMPLVKEGEIHKMYLKTIVELPEMHRFCDAVFPIAEEMYYHSHVFGERVPIVRRISNKYDERKSTLWHSDNHFESVSKIIVYLNDVGVEDAPFEYLRHKETGEVVRVLANQPQQYAPNGRVPKEVIDTYIEEGYEATKALGPSGTVLFFDDKVIHKGNEAEVGHYRDVLMLQLHPNPNTDDPYIIPGKTRYR